MTRRITAAWHSGTLQKGRAAEKIGALSSDRSAMVLGGHLMVSKGRVHRAIALVRDTCRFGAVRLQSI